MRVDTKDINPAFLKILNNTEIDVFLDANFFIPPDRSKLGVRPYSRERFMKIWLLPLLQEFRGLSIHESVYDEIVEESLKSVVDEQVQMEPSRLKIYHDSSLNDKEVALMNYYIQKISVHSSYDPQRDNAKDRGEVRSLSYMAAKDFLFFAAHDGLPIRLIRNASKLNTGLEQMEVVQMYELIFYLHRAGNYDNAGLRNLYKYQYYLTTKEKKNNPEWGDFIRQMDALYGKFFEEKLEL